MKNIKNFNLLKKLFIANLLMLFIACGGGGGIDEEPEEEIKDPTKATLVFPLSNSECTEGSNLSDTESDILFKWDAGDHTDSYVLNLKNLNTGNEVTYTSKTNSRLVRLKRKMPYSWHIVSSSKVAIKTAKSAIWNFYNAGEGVLNYAPFPAEIVSPSYNETIDTTNNEIDLDWTSSDVDGDIQSYEVYLGEAKDPQSFKKGILQSNLSKVQVSSGKTYYWKVETIDSEGNVSVSDLSKFNIK